MYIVASIHNNSLGRCIKAKTWDQAVDFIRGMAEEKLDRPLADEEIDVLVNEGSVYNEEDADNIWSISVGTFDE